MTSDGTVVFTTTTGMRWASVARALRFTTHIGGERTSARPRSRSTTWRGRRHVETALPTAPLKRAGATTRAQPCHRLLGADRVAPVRIELDGFGFEFCSSAVLDGRGWRSRLSMVEIVVGEGRISCARRKSLRERYGHLDGGPAAFKGKAASAAGIRGARGTGRPGERAGSPS
jgi:hypothetical protein